jgi:protein-S-isoprenylcysteine O-methyltransferase Ste14
MRRGAAVLGSVAFFFVAPFSIAGIVPWSIVGWHLPSPDRSVLVAQVIGGVLAAAGTLMVVDSFIRFALKGLGTPAPFFPTRHLVVDGLYRYVRNPIYVGVVSAILGQALVFGSPGLALYGALIWLLFDRVVAGYEEPTLRETFGSEYVEFCRHVRRWIPRLTPWRDANPPSRAP